jgi:hypothetical protein
MAQADCIGKRQMPVLTSAEPKLAVSVTSVTDKVNPLFGDCSRKTYQWGHRVPRRPKHLIQLRSLSFNNLHAKVTVVRRSVTSESLPSRYTSSQEHLRRFFNPPVVKEQISAGKFVAATRTSQRRKPDETRRFAWRTGAGGPAGRCSK